MRRKIQVRLGRAGTLVHKRFRRNELRQTSRISRNANRSLSVRYGGLPIGAPGNEHQGAPLDHESNDGNAASMDDELSDITGAEVAHVTVSSYSFPLRSDSFRIALFNFHATGVRHDFTHGNRLNARCCQIACHRWVSLCRRALSRRCRCQEEAARPRVQNVPYPTVTLDSSMTMAPGFSL